MAFKVARRRFRINVDPLDGFERAEIEDSGDFEVYSVEELAGRRQQDLDDAAAILTAALCGLRCSELLGLLWRAVLWDQQTILVRRSYTEVGGDRLPKGQRVHSVPGAQQVLDLLKQLQALQGDPQPDDRVFQGVEGDTMDGSALYRRQL